MAANEEIDWSQYEDKDDQATAQPQVEDASVDWNQYADKDMPSSIAASHFNDRSQSAPERKGFMGMFADAFEKLHGAARATPDFLRHLKQGIEDIGGELQKHPLTGPFRETAHLAAGGTEFAKNVFNSPHELAKYLQKKELLGGLISPYKIPGTEIDPAWYIPHIPEDTGLQSVLGLNPSKPGDELLHELPAIASLGAGAGALVRSGYKAFTAPKRMREFDNFLSKEIDRVKEEYGLSGEALTSFENALKTEYARLHPGSLGEVTPTGQQVKVHEKTRAINELEPKRNIPAENVGEIPPKQDTEAMKVASEEAITKAQEGVKEAIGSKGEHRKEAGKMIAPEIKNVHDTSSKLYDDVRASYVNDKVKVDNTKEINEIRTELTRLKDADELAPGYGSGTPEQIELQNRIDALEGETVAASDVYDLYRSVDKLARDTRNSMYSGKYNDAEFTRLSKLADKYDSYALKLGEKLEGVGTPEAKSMIKQANRGWKTYKDLTRNPITKYLREGGKMKIPASTIIDLTGEEAGNDFVKALIENDPKLRKHVLGAQFVHPISGLQNIKSLLTPGDIVKGYLNKLPQVENAVNELRIAIKNGHETKSQIKDIDSKYAKLEKSMKEAAKNQKIRQEAHAETAKLQKQVDFHKDAIPKLEAKIKAKKAKGEEVKALEKQRDAHQAEMGNVIKKIKRLGGIGVKLTGLSTIGHKFGL